MAEKLIPTKLIPTRVEESVLEYKVDGREVTTHTYEDLCSVELGATAKGEPQVKSVKAYAFTPQEAAEKALETFNWLSDELAKGSVTHE